MLIPYIIPMAEPNLSFGPRTPWYSTFFGGGVALRCTNELTIEVIE